MDAIDCALLEAWEKVVPRLKADPDEALKRFRRHLTPALSRPMRPWCLCLRASDTRLNEHSCVMLPPVDAKAADWLGPDEDMTAYARAGKTHRLIISGETIRELCRPVRIPWPGVEWTIAGRMLGRHEETLRGWIRRGALKSRTRNAMSLGKRGKPVPIVWSNGALNPNANHGEPPDRMWGTLWQHIADDLPTEYELEVERVAKVRAYPNDPPGRVRQRGWLFRCPGRPDPGEDGGFRECGRLVMRLFSPMPVWTLPRAMGEEFGLDMPRASRLSGAWMPGSLDLQGGLRGFACHHCWRVKYATLLGRDGWNAFITHISAGLLYGHEVRRSLDEAPRRRKRRYVGHRRPSPRRDEAMRLRAAGMTYKQIAAWMGISFGTVHQHLKAGRKVMRKRYNPCPNSHTQNKRWLVK